MYIPKTKIVPPSFSPVCSQRSYIDTKGWDVFRVLPPEAQTRSEATNSKLYFFSIKLLKIVVILLSFVCVLFGTVGAKVAMFLMTSQIRPHKTTAFCNVEIDRSRTYIAEIAGAEQGRSDGRNDGPQFEEEILESA